jgi:signal transduction histidine kinase
MQAQRVDLNALIGEVLDLYRDHEDAVRFETDTDPNLPRVDADPGRLRQLLHNLVKNALEALEHRPSPHIRLVTCCDAGAACQFVELRIEDNGPGIPEAILGQLFEPYITTKIKGTGLGLAIVKKIVEEHGGMIWAENASQGGAKIVIRFPVRPSNQKRDIREQPKEEIT